MKTIAIVSQKNIQLRKSKLFSSSLTFLIQATVYGVKNSKYTLAC